MDKREALRLEIVSLRGGAGMTLDKFAKTPLLMQSLDTDNPEQAKERITALLNSLGDGVKVRSLKAALAIGYADPGILEDRRKDMVEAANRSRDSIKDYEDQAIKQLLTAIENYLSNPKRKTTLVEYDIDLVKGIMNKITARYYSGSELAHTVVDPVDTDYIIRDRFIYVVEPDGPSTFKLTLNYTDGWSPFKVYMHEFRSIHDYNIGLVKRPGQYIQTSVSTSWTEGERTAPPGHVFVMSWDYRGKKMFDPGFQPY